MREKFINKFIILLLIVVCLNANQAHALNAATDYIDSSTGSTTPVTVGNTTTITASHNIDVYHWSSFNLGASETANFVFSTAGQTAVNYLSPGADASTIAGQINGVGASGNVMLFNPNGILINNGTVTNLNTFFASTHQFDSISGNNILFSEPTATNALTVNNINLTNVNNAHFVAPGVVFDASHDITASNSFSTRIIGGGEYDPSSNNFSNEVNVNNPVFASRYIVSKVEAGTNKITSKDITIESKVNYAGDADIIINGQLEANTAVVGEHGSIYLLAQNSNSSVYSNNDIIINGQIGGTSADVSITTNRICLNGTIDVSGDTGGNVDITTKAFDNYGTTKAVGNAGSGGNVNIWATRYVGTRNSEIDVSGTTQGGQINLSSDYQIVSSGTYNATSSTGVGGTVMMSAPLIKLFGANIDASGATGGGNVYLGGSGSFDVDMQTNIFNIFGEASSVKANCTGTGKGGNVVVWSDNTAYVFGNIEAKGNGSAGTGGYVEISGKQYLGYNATVDTGGGTLYIDPKNIIISDSEIGGISYDALFQDGSSLFTASTLNLANNDNFGSSTALYNGLLAIGASGDSTGGSSRGAVYLFSFDKGTTYGGLTLNTKLASGSVVNGYSLNLTDGDNFGSSVTLYDGLLAIGAMNDDTGGTNRGAAYLFNFGAGTTYTNLTFNQKLASGSTMINAGGGTYTLTLVNSDNFGSSIALYNNLLAIGAQGDDTGGSATGAAYLLSFDSGTAYTNLTYNTKLADGSILPGGGGPLSLPNGGGFGSSIALYNNLLAVGAKNDNTGGAGRGAAYLFNFTSGSTYSNLGLTQKLASGSTMINAGGGTYTLTLANGDNFGSSIALYDKLLTIGAMNDDTGGTNRGAAYLLSFDSGTAYANLTYNTKLASGSTMINAGGGTYTLTLANGDEFGSAVALYNKLLTIGAYHDSTGGTNRGAAYLLSFDSGTAYTNLTYNSKLVSGSHFIGPQIFLLNNGDNFGSSTALYNNLLAIGASGDDTGGLNRGAVYLFSFDSGTNYANLTLNTKLADGSALPGGGGPLSLSNNDNFGNSVALYNNLLAVGAMNDDTGGSNRGAAYLFSFDSGTTYTNLALNLKLANGYVFPGGGGTLTLTNGDNFGASVALYNNLLAVGATGDDTGPGTNDGAAYLMSFNTGTKYTNLALNVKLADGYVFPGGGGTLTLAGSDNFGSSAALYNNLLALGASGTSSGKGAAYLMSFNSGTTYTNLALNVTLANGYVFPGGGGTLTLANSDNFGSSAALYGNLLTIGAMNDDTGGLNRGAAYLMNFTPSTTYSSLALTRKLADGSTLANGGVLSLNNNDSFGNSAALYGNLLAIGAMNDDTGGSNRGADYLFSFDSGTNYTNLKLNNKLANGSYTAGDITLSLTNNDFFGSSVTIYGNLITVGAIGVGGGGTNRGAAYLGFFDAGTNYNNLTLYTKLTSGSNINGTTLILADGDNFGSSAALYNNLLTIGAKGDDTGGTDRGAAYLLNFDSGTNYSNLSYFTKLASGSALPGGGGPLTLANGDNFGASAALYNNLLTIGAPGTNSSQGAAFLMSFTSGTVYTNLALNNKLVNGSSFPGGGSSLSLTNGDNFGSAAALYGNLLTIGASGTDSGRGAEYLISFTSGTTYSNLTLNNTLKNASVIGSYTLSLNTGDNFGSSAALSNSILAIGASGDNTGGTDRGADYVLSYDTGTTYSNLVLDTKLADGSTIINSSGGDYVLHLSNGDNFGSATALYNNLFAVGASGTDSGGVNKGAVYLFNIIDQSVGNYTFASYAADTLYLSASRLASWLSTQNVTLQANNDITVDSAVTVTGGTHALTMQAGRSVDINKNITTNNGNLSITANETLAAGVVNANRDAGDATIDMASGTTIDAGTGNVTLTLTGDTTKTNHGTDSITLGNIIANSVTINNQGTVSGNNVVVNGALTIAGTTSVSANSANDITMTNSSNHLVGAVSVGSGNNVSIVNNTATQFGASTISGNLTLTSGAISQSGAISVGGTTSLTAGVSNNITLDNASNNFTGAVSIISGNNVSLRDANAIQMGASNISNNLTIVSNGTMTQSGALSVSGATNLTAGNANDITFTNTSNDFVGDVSIFSGHNASITDANDLQMGTVDITGTLTLISGGGMTQSGAMSVGGTTSLTAGSSNNITLNNSGNDFTGAVSVVSGKDVSLRDKNALEMGASTVSGNLTLVSNGAMTQSGALSVSGTTSLTAGAANNITLDNSSNDFTGTVSVSSTSNLTLNDTNAITLGSSTLNGDLSLTAGGTTHLNSITAANILVLSSGDVIINPGAVLTATGTTNPLTLSSSGGNIINNSNAGALVANNGRWLLYSGSPAETVLNGLTPVGSIFNATYTTVPPTSVPAGNYVLYRVGPPPTPSPGNAAAAAAAAAVLPAALASSTYGGGVTPFILYPLTYVCPEGGITGAATPVIDLSRPIYRIYVDKKGKIKKIEMISTQ